VATEILIRFLSAGLINVGGDDAKLEKLRETATDLAATLKINPSKAAPFALIAFDPEAPTNDPVVREAIDALRNRWTTYVNTFSSTPIEVIRAILLDALVQAANDDDKVGLAFATCARNVLPFMEVGNERMIWADVICQIEQRVDARAETEWATPASITVEPMTFSASKVVEIATTTPLVEVPVLTKLVEAAMGPNNAAGEATGGNPYWPNSGQNWANQFTPKFIELLTETINATTGGLKVNPVDFSGPLGELAKSVSEHVDGALQSVSAATAGLQRRTNLIWWKEALYSPSARASYRGMPTHIAAALMAFDLHKQVPTFSPASVAAFLHETVLSLPLLDTTDRRTLRELLSEASTSEELAALRDAAAELMFEPAGRNLIIGFLGHSSNHPVPDGQPFRDQFGIAAVTPLTVAEWATWLFRELQAARAAQDSPGPKKRARKAQ
jgi:hypothetical protein